MKGVTNAADPDSKKSLSPPEMAKCVMENIHIVTLKDNDEVLYYEGGVYVEGGESEIKSFVEKEDDQLTTHDVEETINHIVRRTYIPRNVFDTDPKRLVINNGIINLDTFEVKEHDPNYLSRVKIPVTYTGKETLGPKIQKFLNEVFYPEDMATAQEFTGYCLWRNYETQKALMLVGEGANGKSTFINLIKTTLGLENISTRSLQELEYNRFAKADIYGKLANLYPDLSDTALETTGQFKMLTGGDPVTAEKKFKNGFPFINYAKLIFSANKLPEAKDDTTAFFRRWIILTFPTKFEGPKENKNLLNELKSPEEISGFFAWSLEGLKRLRENNWVFSNSKSTENVREEYIKKSSPVQAFIMEWVEDDPTDIKKSTEITKQNMFDAFAFYCRESHLPVLTAATFFKKIPEFKKITTGRPSVGVDKRATCYIGVKIKGHPEYEVTEPKPTEDPAQKKLGDNQPPVKNTEESYTCDQCGKQYSHYQIRCSEQIDGKRCNGKIFLRKKKPETV